MFGLTKREQQQAAWEREAALVVPAMVEIAKAALQADVRGPVDCRTCKHFGVCSSMPAGRLICTNADRYDPLPPVRLWRTT